VKTMECSLVVGEDRTALLQFPPDVKPGEHQVVVVIEDRAGVLQDKSLDDLPAISAGGWPAGLSLKREDLYGNDGR
jgi:hypothetical protein